MATTEFTQSERELALLALSEISSDAYTLLSLIAAAMEADGDDQGNLLSATKTAAARIGMLSDMAQARMGQPGTLGGAEHWMLSRATRAALEAA